MTTREDECISIYRQLAKIPELTNVQTIKQTAEGDIFWEAVWSQRDLDRNDRVNFKSSGIVSRSERKLSSTRFPGSTEINGEKITRYSPCGKQKAIIREVQIKDKATQFLEIWHGSCRASCLNLTNESKHGTVHSNASFNCMEWSPDGQKILYVAEKKQGRVESYFKKSSDDDVKKGDEYLYKDEWGEQLLGCCSSTLVIYDVLSESISTIDEWFPQDLCVAQALWCPSGKTVVIHAWKTEPWRLGLIYCNNRPSVLCEVELENKTVTSLTDGTTCVFSPRLAPDGISLVYLVNKVFGPHAQSSKMMCLNLADKSAKPRMVIDIVDVTSNIKDFPGLYVHELPRNGWLKSTNTLVFSGSHRCNIGLFAVDIDNSKIDQLIITEDWTLHNVCDNILFVSHSNPNSPQQLKVGTYSNQGIDWLLLDAPFQKDMGIEWQVLQHEPEVENKDYPGLSYESFLLKPKQKKIQGLVIWPNSGPHICHSSNFDFVRAGLCQLGYAVQLVNFRGAAGYGQHNIDSLPGNLGCQDVKDVQQAVEVAVALLSISRKNLFVCGSSHGGSLTLQLIGQFPDFYAAAASKNPVANIVGMLGATDIPDWVFVEAALGDFKYNYDSTNLDYKKMAELSPIRYVQNVKTPLLMLLGNADIRVPPAQSFEYYKLLRASGGKVRLLKYDNNHHLISEVAAEADCFVNRLLWFLEHTTS